MNHMTVEEFLRTTGQKPGKKFKLTGKPARKTKHRSAAEWLDRYRALAPRPADSPSIEVQRSLFFRRDPVTYRLWLPLSPSNNALKQIRKTIQAGRPKAWMAPTAAAEAYPTAVAEAWEAHWQGQPPEPLTGRLRVLITVHPHQRGIDIANREKALCDALTACGCWADDEQIDDCRQLRGAIVPPYGALDVIIEEIV